MTAALIILIFIIFAALMISRKMPAILAIPAMAICFALAARAPFNSILNDVVAGGAKLLVESYLTVLAGAMLGRVVMQTGVAEGIIKRAAEFGGDQPLAVAVTLMIGIALLFTTLTGLGAIIMVGGLALPIMMSIGVPRKLAGVLFILAYGLGYVFNIAAWKFYQDTFKVDKQPIKDFALVLFVIDAIVVVIFLFIASRRMNKYGAWAVHLDEDDKKNDVLLIALLLPILPLILHIGIGWQVLPSFLISAVLGVLITRPKEIVKQLTSAAVKGLEDVAPAIILMIGIGMLLTATRLPAVKEALQPLIQNINFSSPIVYVLFFGLLSPLALYRGPLNIYGLGIGIFSLIASLGLLSAPALVAAVMCLVQVQNACDPTNTHNVWVANYVGMPVEETTKQTIIFKTVICIAGLIAASILYLR